MDPTRFSDGLRKIRERRLFLWTVFLTYVPAVWLSLEITGSDETTAIVFTLWVFMAAAAGTLVALSRCPRCGNYFHVKGLIPVWVRKCLYCDLSLTADRQKNSKEEPEEPPEQP